ncbi:MAG TPA: heavy metal translocating P-type ATPase [Rariglobus sp.]|jgi:heavy metal translocating P-type ATPase|nr:heavy metal translocating P-type ATPase [Rariglobus sp.]
MTADTSEPGLQADQQLLDRAWLRIGAGLAVAGQSMVFSLAVNVTPATGAGYWVVHGGLIGCALAVLIFLGGDLVRSALASLRERRISVDLLFLVTLLGALTGSLVSSFTHTGSVYYEVVSILIVVHTVGKMLGARSRLAALKAVDRTRQTFDACRVRLDDGRLEERSVKTVAASDCVVVGPGGAIAVDGEIVAGRGYVQTTSMTGEWRPVPHGPGDRVLAGTFSVDGNFEIRATPGPRRLDAILSEVEHARVAPSRLQRQADKLMAWFLPLVVGVSVATFGFWLMRGPWDRALFNAMAVLLVACPCALGLATPVAVWGGLAKFARFGLVARTGDFIEVLARCDAVCLDKTGTLSGENLCVLAWRTAPEWSGREAWLKAAVAMLEASSSHPVAEALKDANAVLVPVREVREEPGLGVVGWAKDEQGVWLEVRVGERALHAGLVDAGLPADKTIHVSVDGAPAAEITLGETWRAGLADTLRELAVLGLSIEVLTGDPHPPADLGVPVRGGLTPADKHARVNELVAAGHTVLFAGDGVNDATAMSAAQASIAMRGGSELARAAAMAVFAGDDLRFLPEAIRVARTITASIRGNLLFAAGYNLVGMALAAAGILHPVVAALLMVGSSAWVSVRALRSAESCVKTAQGKDGAVVIATAAARQ